MDGRCPFNCYNNSLDRTDRVLASCRDDKRRARQIVSGALAVGAYRLAYRLTFRSGKPKNKQIRIALRFFEIAFVSVYFDKTAPYHGRVRWRPLASLRRSGRNIKNAR